MKINWNFLGGGEVQNKKPSVGEYGYFLELYNIQKYYLNRKVNQAIKGEQ